MNELLTNIEKLHTTDLGVKRIEKNLKLDATDVIAYCREMILDKDTHIFKRGKNWYCEKDDVILTINSYSYTIITAHIKR